jgi:hypothetical protein
MVPLVLEQHAADKDEPETDQLANNEASSGHEDARSQVKVPSAIARGCSLLNSDSIHGTTLQYT